MLDIIVKIMIQEIFAAVKKAVADHFKWKKKAKENKEEAKEIVSEKDPQVRAQRMRDFLTSSV